MAKANKIRGYFGWCDEHGLIWIETYQPMSTALDRPQCGDIINDVTPIHLLDMGTLEVLIKGRKYDSKS